MTDAEGPRYRWIEDGDACDAADGRQAVRHDADVDENTAPAVRLRLVPVRLLANRGRWALPGADSGSITYCGQPRTKLAKAPAGSFFNHRFTDEFGNLVQETYVIQSDRSLLLTNPTVIVEDAQRLTTSRAVRPRWRRPYSPKSGT